MKIFIGPREISGYFVRLNEGFRSIGIDSTFIDLRDHTFRYGGSAGGLLVRAIRYCVGRYATGGIFKPAWGVAQLVLSVPLLLVAAARYDVFIFAYGTTFLLLYDLPFLKWLGKKVYFVFLGSDVRPPYLGGVFVDAQDSHNLAACARAARQVKRRIEKIERYADAVISLPTYGLLHQKPFILHAATGFASDKLPTSALDSVPRAPASVRILHSPSNPILKGTPMIEAAIERLRAKGYTIEWVTISGQPNAVVLRELARCDFVIDQLYADWLMPGFATEAALMGKPVIIGGYDLEAIRDLLPEEFVPPVHACHPDHIESAIEKLIVDKTYRVELGQRAKAFVEANWPAGKVAERLLRVIVGDIPDHWRYDPAQITHFHGGGVSEDQLRPFLRAYVEYAGREALHLSDKPALEQALLDFAFKQPPDATDT